MRNEIIALMNAAAAGKPLKDVDLGKSFDKLKEPNIYDSGAVSKLIVDFCKAYKITQNGKEDRYAEAFGLLSMAVKVFLINSGDATMQGIDEMLKAYSNEK